LTGIFEVANELFFLGIDTDDGIAGRDKALFLGRNIAKLRVPIGMLRTRVFFFGINAQRIIMRLQQSTHSGRTDRMTGLAQTLT
jgi:hypothetical protein